MTAAAPSPAMAVARAQALSEARRTAAALRKSGATVRGVYRELTGMSVTWASWQHVEAVIAAVEYARLVRAGAQRAG